MAKPGSRDAKAIANGAMEGVVDLAMAGLSDAKALEAQEALELSMGLRCAGCGRRIGIGLQFTSIAPRDAKRPVIKLAACNRGDCDFSDRAHEGATLMEMVEYAWLDELGLDAPASKLAAMARPVEDAGQDVGGVGDDPDRPQGG